MARTEAEKKNPFQLVVLGEDGGVEEVLGYFSSLQKMAEGVEGDVNLRRLVLGYRHGRDEPKPFRIAENHVSCENNIGVGPNFVGGRRGRAYNGQL